MELNKAWKLWIFRIGFVAFCFTIIGFIILSLWHGWNDDLLKRKPENQKFKSKLERFYYIFGYVFIVIVLLALIF